MSGVERSRERFRRRLEGAVTGLAYASALAALSALAVSTFHPRQLPAPYWGRIDWLRTDTFGFVCFVVAILSFACSEFLRLTRVTRHRPTATRPDPGSPNVLMTATARALVVAGSTLVVYLSANAVTHPQTLALPATHLLSWPTEGTLRAVSLIVTACSVAIARTQRITMSEKQGSCPLS